MAGPELTEPRIKKWKYFPSEELTYTFDDCMIANRDSSIAHAIEIFAVLSRRGYSSLFGEKDSNDLEIFYSLQKGSGIYSYVDALLNREPEKMKLINALEYLCQRED